MGSALSLSTPFLDCKTSGDKKGGLSFLCLRKAYGAPLAKPFVDDQKISGAPGQPEWFLPRASRLPPVLELPVGKLG